MCSQTMAVSLLVAKVAALFPQIVNGAAESSVLQAVTQIFAPLHLAQFTVQVLIRLQCSGETQASFY